MNSTARTTARAQVFITILFLVGYFTVLFALLAGYIRTPPAWKDALIALFGVLTGSLGTVTSFWFSRQRSQEPAAEVSRD